MRRETVRKRRKNGKATTLGHRSRRLNKGAKNEIQQRARAILNYLFLKIRAISITSTVVMTKDKLIPNR